MIDEKAPLHLSVSAAESLPTGLLALQVAAHTPDPPVLGVSAEGLLVWRIEPARSCEFKDIFQSQGFVRLPRTPPAGASSIGVVGAKIIDSRAVLQLASVEREGLAKSHFGFTTGGISGDIAYFGRLLKQGSKALG